MEYGQANWHHLFPLEARSIDGHGMGAWFFLCFCMVMLIAILGCIPYLMGVGGGGLLRRRCSISDKKPEPEKTEENAWNVSVSTGYLKWMVRFPNGRFATASDFGNVDTDSASNDRLSFVREGSAISCCHSLNEEMERAGLDKLELEVVGVDEKLDPMVVCATEHDIMVIRVLPDGKVVGGFGE